MKYSVFSRRECTASQSVTCCRNGLLVRSSRTAWKSSSRLARTHGVTPPGCGQEPLVGLGHGVEVRAGQVADRELDRQLVQDAQRHVQQLGILRPGWRDLGPGVARRYDEPKLLQTLERFPDRRAADTQFLRDLRVLQHLARLQRAVLDPLLKLLQREGTSGRPADWRRFLRQGHACNIQWPMFFWSVPSALDRAEWLRRRPRRPARELSEACR